LASDVTVGADGVAYDPVFDEVFDRWMREEDGDGGKLQGFVDGCAGDIAGPALM
jgi:hypothetical protein